MGKKEQESPFTNRWRIVSMSAWEDDYLDEAVQAFIEFEEKGSGSFQFGYVQDKRNLQSFRRRSNGEPTGLAEFSAEILYVPVSPVSPGFSGFSVSAPVSVGFPGVPEARLSVYNRMPPKLAGSSASP